jgi:hypothetical protein
LVGVAVKVTPVPAQIVLPGFAEILTDGVTVLVTVIVILLDVAVVVLKHVALLVNIQLTIWPFVKVDVVNNELLVPALTPFTLH